MAASKSARLVLERLGLILTRRGPRPTIAPGEMRVIQEPTRDAVALVEYQGVTLGNPPPDRGPTESWPDQSSENT